MSVARRFLNCCQIHWNGWYFLLSPFTLMPLLFLKPELEYRSLFVILWAFIWYVAEVPALAATACLPIVFLPVMGVVDSNTLCMNFTRDTNVLFLCCNFIAIAFQQSNVAQHQAFLFLRFLSCDPRKILLILMSLAYFFTSFLPAAYVCAFLMPTIVAILKYLDEAAVCKAVNEEIALKDDEIPYPSAVANAFYIGVAYAVNIGSITSPLASDSGMALRQLVRNETSLRDLEHLFEVKYFTYSFPLSLLLLIFTIFYLQTIFMGRQRSVGDAAKLDFVAIKANLPAFNTQMFWVVALYILSAISVVVCSIVSPEVENKALKFSANAMMLCFLYYVLPSHFDFCRYFKGSAPKEYNTVPSVLQWPTTHKTMSWTTLFVYGSSSAFGLIMRIADLPMFMAEGLLDVKSQIVQQMGLTGLTSVLTIMGSNAAVAEIMLRMALKAEGLASAVVLLYPITWACCLTFLLPVSSCGNSFALGWGNVRAKDMMLAALGPTFFGLIAVFAMSLFL